MVQPQAQGAEKLSTYQKLKFGVSKEKYKELLTRIQKDNEAFAQLTKRAMLFAARPRKRCSAPDYKSRREEAHRVFNSVNAGLQCDCRKQHLVCLGLPGSSQLNGMSEDPFGLSSHSHRIVLALSPVEKPMETFYVADVEVTVPMSADMACEFLVIRNKDHSQHDDPPCVAILTGESLNDRLSPVANRKTSDTLLQAMVPFPNLLYIADDEIQLDGRTRRAIALTVAASVLHLYSTPWLQSRVTAESLKFVQRPEGIEVQSPFLSKMVQEEEVRIPGIQFQDQLVLSFIRNELLYSLGVFLIELCLGKRLAELQTPQDEVSGGRLQCVSEFNTARRLVERVARQAGTRYGDGVRRCIWCDFDQREYDLDNELFCRAVHEGVVALLAEDVKLIDGVEPLI